MDRAIAEGSILLRTAGTAVGQINGIALYDLAGISFGVPVRITVRLYAGRRGVVNIDREVNLSGAIHDKGALILVGYLGGRYAQEQTLGLSASITFEQSYDEIDGDSASSAELYGLLSALSGCPHPPRDRGHRLGEPARRDPADRRGQREDRGHLPRLRASRPDRRAGRDDPPLQREEPDARILEVIEAVRARKFHVYAVSTVDEGIEVLTGVPAGELRKDGRWTPGSINDRVERRLRTLQEVVRRSWGGDRPGPRSLISATSPGSLQT